KNLGPLIATDMTRCIHCTRCVRFGQEIAGVMELGMIHRGEHSEITTVLGDTVDSEVSGNMIDLCPVGALTSKPFRYSARNWELSRRKSVSPHDSTGTNLLVQIKNNRVMRVLPLENNDVNECWLADRDRFSYEALNGSERLTTPMLKQGGQWQPVDWQTALEYVANGVKQVREQHGAQGVGALVSPHSTVEELFLARQLMEGLGSANIDHRLRNAEFPASEGVRWLGTSIASLSTLQRVLVVGSNLRKDHPLFALRVRAAVRNGAQVSVVHDRDDDWAMAMAGKLVAPAGQWVQALADLATAIGDSKGEKSPLQGTATDAAKAIAASLLSGERKAVLLGNAAAHHPTATSLLALAQWIGEQTGATVGYLTEAANTVGAQLVNALPGEGGLNAGQMLAGGLKAVFLLNTEPEFDSAAGAKAAAALGQADMVVTLSPFKANLEFSDVLLPIAPWTETPGTFVNAEGRVQSFHAVVKPLGEARPAWKVLRVLGNMLGVQGFTWESAQEVLAAARGAADAQQPLVQGDKLSNRTAKAVWLGDTDARPVAASIYQLDGVVRRAPSLQLTADARVRHRQAEEVTA
ncbi:MAG TPA: molybdopterin-dependent oxidoreductase, partial [Ramlibacter sp.]|nr:molybdopterin-dependent oxidoreductase [Ramlibacter sp.]